MINSTFSATFLMEHVSTRIPEVGFYLSLVFYDISQVLTVNSFVIDIEIETEPGYSNIRLLWRVLLNYITSINFKAL